MRLMRDFEKRPVRSKIRGAGGYFFRSYAGTRAPSAISLAMPLIYMSVIFDRILNYAPDHSHIHTAQAGTEDIFFSDYVTKINRKDKGQERVFVVTSAAAYNLDKGRVKRRIAIAAITKITQSSVSDEFVIHVPSEYDYRITAIRKLEAIASIQDAREAMQLDCIPVEDSDSVLLKEVTLTRVLSGLFGGRRASATLASAASPVADAGGGGGGGGAGVGAGAGAVGSPGRALLFGGGAADSRRDSAGSAISNASSDGDEAEDDADARLSTIEHSQKAVGSVASTPAASASVATRASVPMSAQVGELTSIEEEGEESD